MGLTQEGKLYFTGLGLNGCLGKPDDCLDDYGKMFEFIHIPLPTKSPVMAASVGAFQNFLLCEDGSLLACGVNTVGQLALGQDHAGTIESYTNIPLPGQLKLISNCRGYTLIVLMDNTVWATGDNETGQLGLGDTITRWTWTQVTSLPQQNIINILVNECQRSFVVFEDGTVWATGDDNQEGYLGLPHKRNYTTFTPIPHLPGSVKEVVSGLNYVLLILKNGQVYGLGANHNGQLGMQESRQISQFTQITSIPAVGAKAVVASNEFTLILLNDNTLWVAGEDLFGQLGLGEQQTEKNIKTFTQVRSLPSKPIAHIAANHDHSLVLFEDGQLFAAGNNNKGVLGLPKSVSYTSTFTLVEY